MKKKLIKGISLMIISLLFVSPNRAFACTPTCWTCYNVVCHRTDCAKDIQWIPDPNFVRQPYTRLVPGVVYYTKTDPAPPQTCYGTAMTCTTTQLTTKVDYQESIRMSVRQPLPLFSGSECGVSSSADPRDRIPTVMSCAYQHEYCYTYPADCRLEPQQCCWGC